MLYANFSRRLSGLCIDSLLLVVLTVSVMSIAPAVQRVPAVRLGLILTWWAAILLYEPVLVWHTGGTLGHRVMNLRVSDDRTSGNVSLVQALVRFFVKAILGVFSFLTMRFSRRHQAIHDILTRSSVRIRDARAARPHHYTVGQE